MATDLVGNEKLQRFIQLLSELNHQSAEVLRTGNSEIIYEMNDTVEEMHAIQSVGTEDAYTAIEEDMQIICKNFNAVILMMKSNESIFMDKATSDSVKLFMRNIFQATVNIVYAYGLA